MRLEYTTCKFGIHTHMDDGDIGIIQGLGSHFDNVDSGGDVIRPGAFADSIKRKNPKMLWQHDPSEVIGKWDSAEETDAGLETDREAGIANPAWWRGVSVNQDGCDGWP